MDRDRAHNTEPTTGEWRRLAPARLTPGGPGSTDIVGWLRRGALVLLAVSLVWLVFSAVRPLSTPEGAGAPTIHAARPTQAPTITVAEREKLLDSLMATNWFDADHRMWTHQDIAANQTDQPKQPKKTDQKLAERTPETTKTTDTPTGAGVLRTTAPADLPDKLAKAYANLDLRGIRMLADGTLVAMITTVQSPTRPATKAYAIGDSFTDDKFADKAWQVIFIDGKGDRVYLRRDDRTVELPLWRSPDLSVASAGDEAAAAPTGLSREEVIAQLRAAGVKEDEIAELLRMVEDDGAKASEHAQAQAPDVKSIDDTVGQLEKQSVSEDVKSVSKVLDMMSSKGNQRSRRSDRRKLAFPDVDTYAGPERGHTVSAIDADAGVVTLEDGSRWEASARALKQIRAWGSAPAISVYRGRGTSTPYVLVNEITKDIAEVSHMVEPTGDAGADVESADAADGSGD
jgi:hypothetical protein